MKRVALYLRVSSVDQHPETQLNDLRDMAGRAMEQSRKTIALFIDVDNVRVTAIPFILGILAPEWLPIKMRGLRDPDEAEAAATP